MNPDILEFPAEIYDTGELRFLVGDEEKKLAALKKKRGFFGAMCGAPLVTEDVDPDDDPSLPVHYVERTSPPFHVLPGVDRCYMYILDEDEKRHNRDPKIFGIIDLPISSRDPQTTAAPDFAEIDRSDTSKLAIDKRTMQQEYQQRIKEALEEKGKPTWRVVRWDRSLVVPPKQGHYESGLLGRLLCSAHVTEEIDDVQEAEAETYEKIAFDTEGTDVDLSAIELDDTTALAPIRPSQDGLGPVDPDTITFTPRKKARDRRVEQLKETLSIGGKVIKPAPREIIPKVIQSSMKSTMCCGPPTEERRIGSLGSEVSYKRIERADVYTVYAHVDVLCGRHFPAMDENGLCDPVFTIEVANTSATCLEVPPTLNPTYLKRVVLPFEIYMPRIVDKKKPGGSRLSVTEQYGLLKLVSNDYSPLPPIRLTVSDRDEGMYEDSFQQIATISNLHPTNLDQASVKFDEEGSSLTAYGF